MVDTFAVCLPFQLQSAIVALSDRCLLNFGVYTQVVAVPSSIQKIHQITQNNFRKRKRKQKHHHHHEKLARIFQINGSKSQSIIMNNERFACVRVIGSQ